MKPITVVQIETQVQWMFSRNESTRRWLAVCPALKLTIEGDTHSELRENIGDCLNLFFQEMLASNEFERFLRERGWKQHNHIDLRGMDANDVTFDVPIELVAALKTTSSGQSNHRIYRLSLCFARRCP